MTNLRENWLFYLLLLIALYLFTGTDDSRLKKAGFLSKTVLLPYVSSIEHLQKLVHAREENQELSRQNMELLLVNTQLENRLRHLKDQSKLDSSLFAGFIPGEVIGYTGTLTQSSILINRGLIHGIQADTPVLTPEGIAGKIVVALQNQSVLLPVNHPDFRAGVVNKRSRVQGLLANDGQGNTFMEIPLMDAGVSIGDTIVTSNISSVFPKGLPVGVVEKIVQVPDTSSKRAMLKLFVRIEDMENVFLLPGTSEAMKSETATQSPVTEQEKRK